MTSGWISPTKMSKYLLFDLSPLMFHWRMVAAITSWKMCVGAGHQSALLLGIQDLAFPFQPWPIKKDLGPWGKGLGGDECRGDRYCSFWQLVGTWVCLWWCFGTSPTGCRVDRGSVLGVGASLHGKGVSTSHWGVGSSHRRSYLFVLRQGEFRSCLFVPRQGGFMYSWLIILGHVRLRFSRLLVLGVCHLCPGLILLRLSAGQVIP